MQLIGNGGIMNLYEVIGMLTVRALSAEETVLYEQAKVRELTAANEALTAKMPEWMRVEGI